jgi:hypothetical protein
MLCLLSVHIPYRPIEVPYTATDQEPSTTSTGTTVGTAVASSTTAAATAAAPRRALKGCLRKEGQVFTTRSNEHCD